MTDTSTDDLAKTIAQDALGISWRDTESVARRVAEKAAEREQYLTDERDALQARIVELETALRPFVDYVHDDLRKGDKKFTLTPWHHGGGGWICTLDLCRASNALIDKEPTP